MHNELKRLLGKLTIFSQEKLGFSKPPKLFLKNDVKNSQDILGKTAFYDPGNQSVTLFVHNRHPKDILRSFAHELVHHTQNLRGDLSPEKIGKMGSNYAQNNKHMRNMEKEAYLKGNMCFRDWEDGLKNDELVLVKLAESKFLKESKKMATKITKEFIKEKIKEILKEETYIVKRGDYLGKIARKMGVSVRDLAKFNKIKNPNLIYPGQKIVKPGTSDGLAAAGIPDDDFKSFKDDIAATIKKTTGVDTKLAGTGKVELDDEGVRTFMANDAEDRKTLENKLSINQRTVTANKARLDAMDDKGIDSSDPKYKKLQQIMQRAEKRVARLQDALKPGNEDKMRAIAARHRDFDKSDIGTALKKAAGGEKDFRMVAPGDSFPDFKTLYREGIFAPNHYCIHHGGVQHEGKIVAAEAIQHVEPDENGFISHYDMKLPDGTILEDVAAEDIQVTNASLMNEHGGDPKRSDGHKPMKKKKNSKKSDKKSEKSKKDKEVGRRSIENGYDNNPAITKADFIPKKNMAAEQINTPEGENNLYEQRFTPKNNRLFEKLLQEWTK